MNSPPTPKHYPFVDGIRGLTAFYVVLNHIWTRFVATADASSLPPWFHLLKFGHAAVAIFIVLSGFCLMLPIAHRADLALSPTFMKRRGRRILPAYFAAMGLSLLLGIMVPAILPPHSREWQSLLTHTLLIHNWTPRWSIAINGPFWSIALEWQIYLVFALLLMPIRQRVGQLAVVVAAVALVVLPMALRLGGTSPWFLLLFVQGMFAAEWVAHPPRLPYRGLVTLAIVFTLLASAAELMIWRDSFPWPSRPWQGHLLLISLDLLLGTATVSVLLVGALTSRVSLRGQFFGFLERRVCVWLGSFSYSIYLLHDPLLALGIYFATPLVQTAPMRAFPIVLLTVLPATMGLCWLFHLVFERPFLRRSPSRSLRVQ